AGRPELFELGVGEVARLNREHFGGASVAPTFRTVALETGAAAQKDRFAFGENFRRRREGRLRRPRFRQLVRRHARNPDIELSSGLAVARWIGRITRCGPCGYRQPDCEHTHHSDHDASIAGTIEVKISLSLTAAGRECSTGLGTPAIPNMRTAFPARRCGLSHCCARMATVRLSGKCS